MNLAGWLQRNSAGRFLAFSGILLFVGFVFFTTPLTESNQGFDYDGRIYGVMAGEKSFPQDLANLAPWRYRVLTPFLASQLPWSVLTNFRVLALVSNVLALFVLFLVLQQLGFTRQLSVVGLFLYGGVFWTLKFSFYSPAYVDYVSQLLLLLIIYLTLRCSYWLLLPIFILAALQKESLAAFSLFSLIFLFREKRQTGVVASLAYTALVLCVSFGTLLLVRFMVDADGLSSPVAAVMWEFRKALDPQFWLIFLQSIFSGLGFLPLLLLVNFRSWLEFLRQHWEWVFYAAISLLFVFGGSDKGRLFLYFLPLAVILALHSIRALQGFQSESKFMVWVVLFVLAHLYIGRYLTPMDSFPEYLARMVPEHSDGRFLPYLIRNCILGFAVFLFTVQYMIGKRTFKSGLQNPS